MSKLKHIRSEKNCLNCGAEVHAVYCSHCGQPNREPRLGIKDLFHDFIHLMTHFDGKFFMTVKMLLTKPGFLSTEFLKGRRFAYLPPVQMYVLTSAIFFFLSHTLFENKPPSMEIKEVEKREVKKKPLELELFMSDKDSLVLKNFKDVSAYEKFQDSLPASQRDGLIERHMKKKAIMINADFNSNPSQTMDKLITTFTDNISKMLIVSLPFMALIFALVFIRRKELTFVSHLVFMIHLYVFIFITELLRKLLNSLSEFDNLEFIKWITSIFWIWMFYYIYRSISNFYSIKRWKAIAVYGTTLTLGLITMGLLFISYLFLGLVFY